MALSIQWNWAKPSVTVPEGSRFKTSGAAQALSDIAGAAAAADQRQRAREQEQFNRSRQIMLDKQAEADRRRQIAEEERRKKVYGEVAGLMQDNPALATLEAERAEIVTKISNLEKELGING